MFEHLISISAPDIKCVEENKHNLKFYEICKNALLLKFMNNNNLIEKLLNLKVEKFIYKEDNFLGKSSMNYNTEENILGRSLEEVADFFKRLKEKD